MGLVLCLIKMAVGATPLDALGYLHRQRVSAEKTQQRLHLFAAAALSHTVM